MDRQKKVVLWVVGVIGTLSVLLLVFILLLPTLINVDRIRERIVATISERVGAELEFQRVDLSFFPRPRVMVHQGTLSVSGKISGNLESLNIYPEILPMLRGRMRVAQLHVQNPNITIEVPEGPRKKGERPKVLSPAAIEEEVTSILALMAMKAPGLILVVDEGKLNFSQGGRTIHWFRDIQARIGLPPESLDIDFTCNSNLWKNISLEGRVSAEDFKGNGRLHVTDFQPQGLTDHLFTFTGEGIGDSRVNLDISFETDGLKVLHGEVHGSLPYLTLRKGQEKVVIRGKSLKGAFSLDEGGIAVSLIGLDLAYPQLSMSGKFRLDQKAPSVSVGLEGKDVDVHSTREAVLALAGKQPTVQEIFNYVRRGKIPLITLSAQGSSVADLGELENILIKGSMVEGEIFIPGEDIGLEGIDLELEDAKGDVVISGGILEGKNLEARWGRERGRDGTLKLGFEGADAPFHLEVTVEADLSRVPPLLKTLIKDETFAQEIARAHEIKGKALGRLVIGESTKALKAKVDVSAFNLSARYDRLPYPLEIRSGRLSYDVDRVSVKGLSGRLGKSPFSGVAAQVGWEKVPYLEVLSGKSTILLDEIYPWLSSLEGFKGVFKRLKSVQGTVVLSTVNAKGPLVKPEKWRFRVTGEMEDVVADWTGFPDPLTVTTGQFGATPERISIKNARVRISDCSLGVTASLNDPLKGLKKADLILDGKMGPEGVQWVSDLIDLPPSLRVRSPLALSGTHVGWDRDGRISFSGNLVPKGGPKVSIDMLHNPTELIIKNVSIRDEVSQASFGLRRKEREFHVNFIGNLDKRTLDGLLVKNQILNGLIRGDFAAHIPLDNPMKSTAQGKLHGVGLGYPVKLKVPVMIEDVSLAAAKNKLNVESALITWGDSHLTLQGDVKFSEEEFLFDMNLSADGIEWEAVEQILKGGNQKSDLQRGEDLRIPLLEGILRVRLEFFKYGRFTWRPLRAEISFDRDTVKVAVTEANLCGISTPGTLNVFPQGLELAFKPVSKNQELDPTLACLWDKKGFISGNFDLQGKLDGQGKKENLARSLHGNFEFLTRDGRIFRFRLLSRVIGFINLTEVFRAKLPDLGKEGLAYDSITIKGNLRGGKLNLKEAILDGSTLEIVGKGEIDLTTEKMNLSLLVAPLKTVDSVVKKIPIVRDILGGTLISYPVKVRGDLAAPRVSALSPSAVGSELLAIMKRTFHLPVKILRPSRPSGEKK